MRAGGGAGSRLVRVFFPIHRTLGWVHLSDGSPAVTPNQANKPQQTAIQPLDECRRTTDCAAAGTRPPAAHQTLHNTRHPTLLKSSKSQCRANTNMLVHHTTPSPNICPRQAVTNTAWRLPLRIVVQVCTLHTPYDKGADCTAHRHLLPAHCPITADDVVAGGLQGCCCSRHLHPRAHPCHVGSTHHPPLPRGEQHPPADSLKGAAAASVDAKHLLQLDDLQHARQTTAVSTPTALPDVAAHITPA